MTIKGRWTNALTFVREADRAYRAGEEVTLIEASQLQELTTEVEDFRMLSGGSLDDLQYRLRFQQQASYNLWRKNLLAQRLIDVNVDFMVGDGTNLVAKYDKGEDGDNEIQDAIQEVLDDLWYDPVNDMDDSLETKATEILIWGEVCMPATVNATSGSVRLGWVCPLEITEVHSDPVTGDPAVVEVTDQAAGAIGQKKLEVIRYNSKSGLLEGDCFYARIRGLKGTSRGVPELSVSLNWLNTLEKTLKAVADRAKVDTNFMWDIILKGKSNTECQTWIKKYWQRPAPGAVRVHNENAEINAVSPSLGANEMNQHVQMIKNHIVGGYGFPNHWFGSGNETNLATAAVMAEPTRKALRRKQKAFRRLLCDIARYRIQKAVEVGVLSDDLDLSRDPFSVNMPDLSGPDIAKVAAGMQGVITSLIVGVENNLLSESTAIDIAAAAYGESGIEVDAAKEREAIIASRTEKEAKAKEEEDEAEQALQEKLLAQAKSAAAGATGDNLPVQPEV